MHHAALLQMQQPCIFVAATAIALAKCCRRISEKYREPATAGFLRMAQSLRRVRNLHNVQAVIHA